MAMNFITKWTKRNSSLCFSQTQVKWAKFILPRFSLSAARQHRY